MELKINIDESRFKDVLEKELAAFSHEELHELIRECIATALRDNDALQKLFIQSSSPYSYVRDEPTALVRKAAESFDLSPAFAEIQEKMISELKTNYSAVLERTMAGVMMQGMCADWRFQQSIKEAVDSVLSMRDNNN